MKGRWYRPYLFVAGLVLGFFGAVQTARAATITQLSYGESGSVVGTFATANTADFNTFTPITAITAGSTITLTFPSGTSLSSTNLAASDFLVSQTTDLPALCINAGVDTAPTAINVNAANRTIELTVASGSLSTTAILLPCGLGQVTVKTSGTMGGNEIQHPTTTTTAGTFQVATSVGDSGSISTVTFVHDVANQLAFSTQPSSTATAGQDFGTQPVVRINDQYGNLVSSDNSTTVTLAAVLAADGTTAGGGTLNVATNPVTASSGLATFAGVDYTKAENIKLKATATGLTQVLSAAVSVSAAGAATMARTSGNNQTASTNVALSAPLLVTITDAFGNPVSGTTVNFSITAVPSGASGQSLSSSSGSTDANGEVPTTLTTGDLSGTYAVSAAASGLTSVVFSATADGPPIVTSLSTGARGQDSQAQTLTVTGNNFLNGAAAAFSGTGVTLNSVTFNSVASLTLGITVAADASLGGHDLTITNPGNLSGTLASALSITARPVIAAISPNHVDRGVVNQTVIITGSGFSGSSINFGGGIDILETTVVSTTEIRAKVTARSAADLGSRSVLITNSDGGRSEPGTLRVAPELTIGNIAAVADSPTTATITWTTSNPTRCVVRYGASPQYGRQHQGEQAETVHRLTVGGLAPGWVHHFRIEATDQYGQIAQSSDQAFTAATLPTLSVAAPALQSVAFPLSGPKITEPTVATPKPSADAPVRTTFVVIIRDHEGKPVQNARVELRSTPKITTTDAQGRATFSDVELGRHELIVAYRNVTFAREIEVAANPDNPDEARPLAVTLEAAAVTNQRFLLALASLTLAAGIVVGLNLRRHAKRFPRRKKRGILKS